MGGKRIGGFLDYQPSDVDQFRGIVLFGRNVATYKFALAKSLVELAERGHDRVSLAELAVPFAGHVAEHLAHSPKQSTSASSKYLDACRDFNAGVLTREELTAATVRLGFNNVIDAFHVVGNGEVPTRFFVDERRLAPDGIVLTDAVFQIAQEDSFDPVAEVEARWRLVESAWDLRLDTSLIEVDSTWEYLTGRDRRSSITSSRDALNGYQRGTCFYCYMPIGIAPGASDLADVDHVFPHVLQRHGILRNLDGVWNLVLACVTCNRGPEGKSDAIPVAQYVERLFRRNEYLIASAHPLRETLIAQTGPDTATRQRFLQRTLSEAGKANPARWSVPPRRTGFF